MRKGRLDFDPLARPAPIIPGQDSTKEQIEAEINRLAEIGRAKRLPAPGSLRIGPWRSKKPPET